jgi:gluconate 2-dehydrogenase gamma chain
MNRRDLLKTITLSSLGLAGLNPQVFAAEMLAPPQVPLKIPGGRQAFEAERDARLKSEKFFTPQELLTVTVLADIIIPADEKSGSASQAGVPAFIEFMMKDQPRWQTPMRGGLAWLDNKSRKLYGKPFAPCSKAQQIELVDQIAYPEQAKPEMLQGVAFFNLMRNFTATGFFTSKMGIADLGYQGNKPNQWEGVPPEVLKQYNVSYED